MSIFNIYYHFMVSRSHSLGTRPSPMWLSELCVEATWMVRRAIRWNLNSVFLHSNLQKISMDHYHQWINDHPNS